MGIKKEEYLNIYFMGTKNKKTKIYFFALLAVITICFAQCSLNVSNCNKILDFKKLNGDYFSEIEIKPKIPVGFLTNNYLIFLDNSDLGALFYSDTSINLSNFLYKTQGLDSGINLSPLALYKISLGKQNKYYLITYNIDNFLGTNGEMLGILINPQEKLLSKIIYIPLSEIYTIGDADKNEKLDILTFNNGDDNFLNNDSTYTFLLSEFDSKGNLQIRNKGHVLFTEPDLLIDSCKYSFLRN